TVLVVVLGKEAPEVFVLLFIGVLISLYLRALAGVIERRLKVPDPFAYVASLLVSVSAIAILLWVLVPPVVEQTQQLFGVLPDYIAGWEAGLERAMNKYPGLRDIVGPGDHRILRAVYDRLGESFGDVVPRALGLLHGAID